MRGPAVATMAGSDANSGLDQDILADDFIRDEGPFASPPKPPPRRKRTPTPGTEADIELLTSITAELTVFRLSLAASQNETLQKLDAEIDRLTQKLSESRGRSTTEPPPSPGVPLAPPPTQPPPVLEDEEKSSEKSVSSVLDNCAAVPSGHARVKVRRNSSASVMQDPSRKKPILRRRSASVQEEPISSSNSVAFARRGSRRHSYNSGESLLPGQTGQEQNSGGTDSESITPIQPRARTAPGGAHVLPSLASKTRRGSWFKQAPKIREEKPRWARPKTKKDMKTGSKEASPRATPDKRRVRTETGEAATSIVPSEGTPHLSPSASMRVAGSEAGASPVKSAPTIQQADGLFGGMHSEFSIESVQRHLIEGVPHEMADNRCSDLVSHPVFDRFMMTVVILNCIELAVSVEFDYDASNPDLHTTLVSIENVFCVIFLLEIVLRSFTYRRIVEVVKDGWFLFDLLLVLLMVWETWLMPILQADNSSHLSGAFRMSRILRVLRTARMARLVRLMPELMILIKGMIVACRSVFFTLLLLLIITFMFSIAFLELSRGTILETDYFPSTLSSILSLILHCIVPDQEVFFRAVVAENWALGVLVLFFILLGSLTVMNMLLGVLVEAVKTVSTIEREQMMADFARRVLWQLIQSDKEDPDEDEQCDRMISEQEFKSLLRKPRAVKALAKLGVDPQNALDNGKLLFEDGESVSFMDFMRAMLMLRGSNKTTVKDMVEMRKYLGDEFAQIRRLFAELATFIQENMDPDVFSQVASLSYEDLDPHLG